MNIKFIIKELLVTSKLEQQRSNKNRLGLILDMLHCRYRYGTTIPNYRAFGFALIDKKYRKEYFTGHEFSRFVEEIDKDHSDDKYDTYLKYKNYYHRDIVHLLFDQPKTIDHFLKKHRCFFAKKTLSYGGYGVEYVIDPSAAKIEQLKHDGYHMFEEEIQQHPEVSQLNPTSVNTLRVVTIRGEDNSISFLPCILRVGSGGKVDNVSSGGGAYLLIDDDGSAILNGLYQENIDYIKDMQQLNPVNMPEDFKVPYYQQALEMCQTMAIQSPQYRIIGWDIAISKKGPVLVELNLHPDIIMNQNYYVAIHNNQAHAGVKTKILKLLGKA